MNDTNIRSIFDLIDKKLDRLDELSEQQKANISNMESHLKVLISIRDALNKTKEKENA